MLRPARVPLITVMMVAVIAAAGLGNALACPTPGAAPSVVACHPSLDISGNYPGGLKIETCVEGGNPLWAKYNWNGITACNKGECLIRTYEQVGCGPYIKTEGKEGNDPPCKDGAEYERVQQELAKGLNALTENPKASELIAHTIAKPVGDGLTSLWNSHQGFGDLGELLHDYVDQNAVCHPMAAVLPVGAELLRWALFTADTDHDNLGAGACFRDATGTDPVNCRARPWTIFKDTHVIRANNGASAVVTLFKNWRSDAGSRPGIVVWFAPPSNFKDLLSGKTHK